MSMNNPTQSPPERPQVAVGVVVIANDQVLLIRRGHAPRAGQWSIPGGRQELGETLAQAACREVREETGLDVRLTGLLDVVDGIFRSPDGAVESHYTLVDFAAVPVSGELIAGDDALDACWVSRADLINFDLWSETRRMIDLAFVRHSMA
jgi:mutator protein MutT